MYQPQMANNQQLVTKIELSLSCTNIVKLDLTSQSDPMVLVQLQKKDGSWERIGTTEIMKNNPNPNFATPIGLSYYFEEIQKLKFLVLDIDHPKEIDNILKGQDHVGEVESTVAEIVGAKGSTKTFEIKNNKHPHRNNGKLTVKAIEVGQSNVDVTFKMTGTKLDKKDFLGKSDPYLIFHRSDASGNFTPIHKTEIIKHTLDPVWKEFTIPLTRLCGGNPQAPIMIECFDWDSDGGDDLIGRFTTNYNELKTKKAFELIEPHIQAKKGKKYVNSGVINVVNIKENRISSFLDYVTSGTEISLVVGIDYTGSNGNPTEPTSLHYFNIHGPNEYMQGIRVIGDILAPYDNDGLIPAYGFGAKFTDGTVSHCFNVNGQPNPNCQGINGILLAYQESFKWLQLYGPTNFAPIITQVAGLARAEQLGSKYYILLMLTDGEITDMDETIKAIRAASTAPLSIIIVGVGGHDFKSMETLDDDDHKLFPRDIVQFVPFRKFSQRPITDLAKETLAEVPAQLVQFFAIHGVAPRNQH